MTSTDIHSATENVPKSASEAPIGSPAVKAEVPSTKAAAKLPGLKTTPPIKAARKAVSKKIAAAPVSNVASTRAIAKVPPAPTAKVPTKALKTAPAKAATQLPVKPAVKILAEKISKQKKPKLVHDSFTIPKSEYSVLNDLKQRSVQIGDPAKKSELLRAGIKALAAMTDAAFKAALNAVPTIKTGRPAKD